MTREKEINIKVGLFTILSLLLILVLFIWKSGIFIKIQGKELIGEFDTIAGLLETAPVRYRGYKIGYVESVNPKVDKIYVKVKLMKKIQLPIDSFFRIEFDGLVGQKYLSLVAGESEYYLEEAAIIPGISTRGLVDFVNEGANSMVEARKLLENFNRILGSEKAENSFMRIATNIEDSSRILRDSLPQLKAAVDHLNNMMKQADDLLGRDQIKDDIESVISNSRQISEQLNSLVRNLDQTVSRNSIELEESIKEFNKLMKKLNKMFSNKSGDNNNQLSKLALISSQTRISGAITDKQDPHIRFGADIFVPGTGPYYLGLSEKKSQLRTDLYKDNYFGDSDFGYRYGVLYSQLGAGVFYDLYRLRIELQAYDTTSPKAEGIMKYQLSSNWGLLTSLSNEENQVGLEYSN